VLYGFFLFIIKKGSLRVGQASFSKMVYHPTTIIDSQTNEELALEWSPTHPNLFLWCKFDGPAKECSIS
jgi:hypothetical protein